MDPSQQGGQQPHQPHPAQQPHPAYQPHQPYPSFPTVPMAPPSAPVNGLSIVSLVSGIVCCLPPLGLIFGLIALSQIRRRGERGKGMAVAGTILSALSTLLTLTLLVTGVLGGVWEGLREGVDEASRSRSTLDLRKGDCFNLPGNGMSEEKETDAVEAVECAGEHQAEIAGGLKITGFDVFPGARRLETMAEQRCQEINDGYAMDPWEVPGNMDYYYYLPTRESWRLGDREITCGFATTKGETTTGSVRRDATILNPHQMAYLRAEVAVMQVQYLMPEAEFAQDVTAHQRWAGKMADAFTGQARALRQNDWPPGAAGAVTRRAQEFERASTHWEKASQAKAEESFWQHTQVGDYSLREKTEIAIRGAIGLVTVPPIDETEDDSSF